MLGSIGHFVQEVALFWITYEITGSAMALGILGLCSALPRLILGALSGVLVDRYDRKLLLTLVNFGSVIPIAKTAARQRYSPSSVARANPVSSYRVDSQRQP